MENHTTNEIDDENTPFETIIYYSKGEAITGMFIGGFCSMLFMLPLVFILPNMFSNRSELVLSSFLLLMFFLGLYIAYASWLNYKKAVKRVAQIIFNEEGLRTANTNFLTWDTIKNVEIHQKASEHCLTYEYAGGKEKFTFNGLELGVTELKKLLKIYRHRFEQNNKLNNE